MVEVPKRANDAMHLAMLHGLAVSVYVLSLRV